MYRRDKGFLKLRKKFIRNTKENCKNRKSMVFPHFKFLKKVLEKVKKVLAFFTDISYNNIR